MAALFLGKTLFSNTAEAIVGTLAMFVLMVLLVVFAAVTKIAPSALRWPSLVLTWLLLIQFVAVAMLTVTAAFFKWPVSFEELKQQFTNPTGVFERPTGLPTIIARDVTPENLPPEMVSPVSHNLDSSALARQLAQKGSLTLDGNTLTIGPIGANIAVTIAVHTLTLARGASIVTNGNTITIQAVKIVGGGSIVSFLPNNLALGIAGSGQAGATGHEGGTVYLEAASGLEGNLTVDLSGQSGGQGGQGGPGSVGSAGARGSNAVEGFLDCRSGGQDGGKGGPGSPGQTGGVGGNGGNGGTLVLARNLTRQLTQITFVKSRGEAGKGGVGGSGGPGGPGGEGGSGSARCGGGHGGPPGEVGSPGQSGADGKPGAEGQLQLLK
jgi:hypothetical protein